VLDDDGPQQPIPSNFPDSRGRRPGSTLAASVLMRCVVVLMVDEQPFGCGCVSVPRPRRESAPAGRVTSLAARQRSDQESAANTRPRRIPSHAGVGRLHRFPMRRRGSPLCTTEPVLGHLGKHDPPHGGFACRGDMAFTQSGKGADGWGMGTTRSCTGGVIARCAAGPLFTPFLASFFVATKKGVALPGRIPGGVVPPRHTQQPNGYANQRQQQAQRLEALAVSANSPAPPC
jgi:hypothetical protein